MRRAGARDQDRVGAFGERRRGGVASLPAVCVLERVATAGAHQRQHAATGACCSDVKASTVERSARPGDRRRRACPAQPPARQRRKAILDPRARCRSGYSASSARAGSLARLGIVKANSQRLGVAVVQKRPLVDIEQRAAAFGRRATAGIETPARRREASRVAAPSRASCSRRPSTKGRSLLQRLASARGAAAVQRGCRVGADFATATIHLEPHRGGIAELVASDAQRIDDRATRIHQARDRVEQCAVEESAVGLRLDPAEAANLDPLRAGDSPCLRAGRATPRAATKRRHSRTTEATAGATREHPDGSPQMGVGGGPIQRRRAKHPENARTPAAPTARRAKVRVFGKRARQFHAAIIGTMPLPVWQRGRAR